MPSKKKNRRSPEERRAAIKKLLVATGNVATKRFLVERIIEKVGGIDALAGDLAKMAKDPNTPPSLKTKIFELIVRSVGEAEDPDPIGPEDLADETDLEAYIETRVIRLAEIEDLDPTSHPHGDAA